MKKTKQLSQWTKLQPQQSSDTDMTCRLMTNVVIVPTQLWINFCWND